MDMVYGIHAVDSLLRQSPGAVSRLRLQRGRGDRRRNALVARAREQGVPVQWETRAALDELVDGRHQGVVAETGATTSGHSQQGPAWSEADLLAHIANASRPPLLLILDGVTDPHNLGACLRSADAAGVDAVVAPKDKSAGLTPGARKVACGAAETVPFVQVTNLRRALAALRAGGVWLFGADHEAAESLYNADLTGPAGLVLGGEGDGMRRLTRESCDFLVHLPMAGSVSSLNVSVAAGICLFEAVRQRSRPPG